MTCEPEAVVPRGRPLDSNLDEEILSATHDLLAEVGYERLTMEAVAARAGVGKGAIYRRWSSRAQLVAAAVGRLRVRKDVPDTGTLRGDLGQIAAAWSEPNSKRDRVLVGLIAAIAYDEDLRRIHRETFSDPRTSAVATVLARAVGRGEVRADLDLEVVTRTLPALVFYRLVVEGRPADRAFLDHVVDQMVLVLTHPRPVGDRAG